MVAGIAGGIASRSTGYGQTPSGEIVVQFESRGSLLEQEVRAAIDALTAGNAESKIDVADQAAGDYLTELTLSLLTGDVPDVFEANSLVTAQLAVTGAVLPLDGYLQAWPDWSNFHPAVKQNLMFEGATWGLPQSLDTHFLYYRKDLFARAGLPVSWQPVTLDDVIAAARTIKQVLPEIIPLVLFAGANPGNSTAIRGFLPLLRAYGGELRDKDGKWIIDSCAIRNALAFYELAYQIEAFVPQRVMSSVSASNAMRAAFAAGEAAISFDGSWVWDDWSESVADMEGQIGYVLHPTADGSPPFTVGGIGKTWFINAATEYPELCWAFVAAMSGRDVLTRLNLNDPHVPPRLDSAADPGFQSSPFNKAMAESFSSALLSPPDPSYQSLVSIIQNATGLIAAGEVSAAEAVERYAGELSRVLGDDNVVMQPCP